MKSLQNKVIWITGASSGIGEALSYALAQEGARLVLSARRQEELERVKGTCENSPQIMILPLDLTEPEAFTDHTSQVIDTMGHIDILINNGGISQRSKAKDTLISVDRRIMEVNYFGAIGLSKEVLPHMLERKSGMFVVISSVAGKIGVPMRTSYSASKFALHGFFEALRAESWRENVKVLMVCPGFVQTQISINALKGDGQAQNKMDQAISQGLDVNETAQKIVQAIKNEKEEILISKSRERYGVWLKRFFPKVFSRMIRRASVV